MPISFGAAHSFARPNRVEVALDEKTRPERNLLLQLSGQGRAETTGEDNLKTVRLVNAAYESATSGSTVLLK